MTLIAGKYSSERIYLNWNSLYFTVRHWLINGHLKPIPDRQVNTWPHAATAEVCSSRGSPARSRCGWVSWLCGTGSASHAPISTQPAGIDLSSGGRLLERGPYRSDMRSNRRGRAERHWLLLTTTDPGGCVCFDRTLPKCWKWLGCAMWCQLWPIGFPIRDTINVIIQLFMLGCNSL